MINKIQEGDRLTYANASGATIASGKAVLVGKRIGIASGDILDAESGVLAMEGVYSIPKLSTDVIAQGDLLYWDDTSKRLTSTATSNTLAGFAFAAAGSGITTVNICINR